MPGKRCWINWNPRVLTMDNLFGFAMEERIGEGGVSRDVNGYCGIFERLFNLGLGTGAARDPEPDAHRAL